MASAFQIFEDQNREKENRGVGPPANKLGAIKGQEKRPTLAVLGERDLNNENIKITALHDQKLKNLLNTKDENAVLGGLGGKKPLATASTVPLDQFKAFSVFEDTKSVANIVVPAIKVDREESSNDKDVSGLLREPLSELTTPMSVGGVLSPMSVDKSICLIDDTADKTVASRSDLERFFDVEEYQRDILEYLKQAELKHRPKPGYMRKQPDITHSMRTILVDWLVEVGEEYRLQSETLCLAISYIDRFLSYMSVVRAKLQLVGTSAMFIAAKYEEIYPPDVGEFVYITDDTYTRSQVLRMEQLILKVLSFDLSVPTALAFTTLYSVMNEIPDKVKHLTMYLCELALLDADPFLQYVPSKISAAAVAVARHTLEYPMWSKSLEENVGYTLDDLKEIIYHLEKSHKAAAELGQQAIQEKYKSSKFSQVATLPPRDITDESFQLKESNESVRKMISSLAF